MKVFAVLFLVGFLVQRPEAARFRHPLTVPNMESFAAPMNFVGAAGTPERYADLGYNNRYAYRLRNEDEEAQEPVAAQLKMDDEKSSVFRRNDQFIERLRRERELSALYEKIAQKFPYLVKQGLYTSPGEKLSLDHLFGMTVFGQPKLGRK